MLHEYTVYMQIVVKLFVKRPLVYAALFNMKSKHKNIQEISQ